MEDSGSQQFSRGDRISDRFEIEKHIGSGMLGVTYLAKDTKNATPVALKFVKPKLVAHEKDRGRFEQAFARSAAVQGEGLIPFGEIGEHDGQLYYSQEYFPSQNLRQLIDDYQRQQKSFSLQESCQIVLKVLEAVQQLHDAGIIHGNLKPENILVQSRQAGPGGSKVVRTIKVDDAGLAAVVNPTIFADSYISRDEARYLAPELSSFDEDGAFPSDVYSVGVIFYELLVGQTPRGTYLSPTQLRGDLAHHIDDIVELAISESAEDRYRTAVDMLNDIQRSFSGEFIDDRRSQTFRNVLIGLFAAVVTVLVVGGYLVSGEPDDGYNEAVAQDNQIRSVVKAQNPLPTQEEWEAKLLPGMIYVPGGSFVMGR
ncbi:MAG: serine/threonine-protein kinase, partial [Myxococcota bacterium]|nr:serine/threonine-protein kinase [Myxococcota bacterium]